MRRVYVLVIFLTGFCFGAASAIFIGYAYRHGIWPGSRDARRFAYFSSELRLTTAQKSQIQSLLETKRQKMTALFAGIQPQLDMIRQNTRQEIRTLLTPEQQTRFDQLISKHRADRKKGAWHHHWE